MERTRRPSGVTNDGATYPVHPFSACASRRRNRCGERPAGSIVGRSYRGAGKHRARRARDKWPALTGVLVTVSLEAGDVRRLGGSSCWWRCSLAAAAPITARVQVGAGLGRATLRRRTAGARAVDSVDSLAHRQPWGPSHPLDVGIAGLADGISESLTHSARVQQCAK